MQVEEQKKNLRGREMCSGNQLGMVSDESVHELSPALGESFGVSYTMISQ